MTLLFTQVWLWSLAAFLLGSLFTWLLFGLPLKRRLNALSADYARQPPPRLSRPDGDDESQPTALDLFEPQRPIPVPMHDDGYAAQTEFPGPGRWEAFDGAWREEHDVTVARSRNALVEPPVPDGMAGLPAGDAGPGEPTSLQSIEANRSDTRFDGPAPGMSPAQKPPDPMRNPRGQAEHRVPPYVPPSDPEITQVIPRIAEDADDSDTQLTPGEQYMIKGHFASRQYHTPDSPQYNHIVAEVWFRTVEDAEQAGFESWNARTH